MTQDANQEGFVPLTIHLDPRVIEWLDSLTAEFGMRSRDALAARLLANLAGIDVES